MFSLPQYKGISNIYPLKFSCVCFNSLPCFGGSYVKRQRTYNSDAQMQKATEKPGRIRKVAGREFKKYGRDQMKKRRIFDEKGSRTSFALLLCFFLYVCVVSTYWWESLRFYSLFTFLPHFPPLSNPKIRSNVYK